MGQPYGIQGYLINAVENKILAPDPEAKYHDHKPKIAPVFPQNGTVDGI